MMFAVTCFIACNLLAWKLNAQNLKTAIIVLFGISIGVSLLVFHKQFAERCIEDQNRRWGSHFGEREVRRTKLVVIIVGLGFIIMALLCLFGIARVR